MSDAIETHEACCKLPTNTCPCPVCGNTGRKALENSLNARLSAATPSVVLSAMASRTTSLGSRPTVLK